MFLCASSTEEVEKDTTLSVRKQRLGKAQWRGLCISNEENRREWDLDVILFHYFKMF